MDHLLEPEEDLQSQSARAMVPLARRWYDSGDVPLHIEDRVADALHSSTLNEAYEKLQEHNQMSGGSVFKWLHQAAQTLTSTSLRMNYPPKMRTILTRMGADTISTMTACRTPVEKHVQTLLNIASMGQYGAAKAKLPYDELYHVYLVFTTQKHGSFLMEKNHVLELTALSAEERTKREKTAGYASMPIPVKRQCTMNEVLAETRKNMGEEAFFRYNAFNNNCQVFLNAVLTACAHLNLIDYTGQLKSFVFQDVTSLASELSSNTHMFAQTATDLAHKVHHLLHGSGFNGQHARAVAQILESPDPYSRANSIHRMDMATAGAFHRLARAGKTEGHRFLAKAKNPLDLRNKLHQLNNTQSDGFFKDFIESMPDTYLTDQELTNRVEEGEGDDTTLNTVGLAQKLPQGKLMFPSLPTIDGTYVNPNDYLTPQTTLAARNTLTNWALQTEMPKQDNSDPAMQEQI